MDKFEVGGTNIAVAEDEEEYSQGLNSFTVGSTGSDLSRTQLQKVQSVTNKNSGNGSAVTLKSRPKIAAAIQQKTVQTSGPETADSKKLSAIVNDKISTAKETRILQVACLKDPLPLPPQPTVIIQEFKSNSILGLGVLIYSRVVQGIDSVISTGIQSGKNIYLDLLELKQNLIKSVKGFFQKLSDTLGGWFNSCTRFTADLFNSASRFIKRLFESADGASPYFIPPVLSKIFGSIINFITEALRPAGYQGANLKANERLDSPLPSDKPKSVLELINEAISKFVEQLKSRHKTEKEQRAEEVAARKEAIRSEAKNNYLKAKSLRPDLDVEIEFPQIDFVSDSPHFEPPSVMDLIEDAERRKARKGPIAA